MNKTGLNETGVNETGVNEKGVNEKGVWHAGELAMQRVAGVDARMAEIGPRVIRDHLPDQHREFFEQLPMVVVGGLDAAQRPWASVLARWPGFISSPDDRRLRVDALPAADDPLRVQLGGALGLLGIEPETRRRNRANGHVTALDAQGFELGVEQSFGNCPQHIRPRAARWRDGVAGEAQRESAQVSDVARALIAAADSFFIASAVPGEGVDVSHRGGDPALLRIDDAAGGTVLSWPEYRGNFFFNTLGNLVAHPFAGLLFIDHASGGVLQLTGRASVHEGEQRRVSVEVDAGVWRPQALPLRWGALQ